MASGGACELGRTTPGQHPERGRLPERRTAPPAGLGARSKCSVVEVPIDPVTTSRAWISAWEVQVEKRSLGLDAMRV